MKQLAILAFLIGGIALSSAFTKEKPLQGKAALGRRLFFDPILSEDASISCASCHRPEFAFADTLPLSPGVHGKPGIRNTPGVMNTANRESFFWDGRAASLAQQALGPIANESEMNMPVTVILKKLKQNAYYRAQFKKLFGKGPDAQSLGAALQAFEETLETGDTPNDRWLNDEPNGLTEQQVRGREIFRGKGKCFECHYSPDFTGDEFRNIGLFNGSSYNDSGRYAVTHEPADIGRFKVPGLRNVAVTAPYMHDGSFKTLRAVIDYYDNPDAFLPDSRNRDTLLRQPLRLNEQEKEDLESFLHGLTDDRFIHR